MSHNIESFSEKEQEAEAELTAARQQLAEANDRVRRANEAMDEVIRTRKEIQDPRSTTQLIQRFIASENAQRRAAIKSGQL